MPHTTYLETARAAVACDACWTAQRQTASPCRTRLGCARGACLLGHHQSRTPSARAGMFHQAFEQHVDAYKVTLKVQASTILPAGAVTTPKFQNKGNGEQIGEAGKFHTVIQIFGM
eukprot:1142566-Pelagomonas_calceolata.AAC.3